MLKSITCLVLLIALVNLTTAAENMWCCQIEVPAKPFFNNQGHLLGYEPQPCPEDMKVCCKGHVNILGSCLTLQLANQMLPIWQQTAQEHGITLAEAIHMVGVGK